MLPSMDGSMDEGTKSSSRRNLTNYFHNIPLDSHHLGMVITGAMKGMKINLFLTLL